MSLTSASRDTAGSSAASYATGFESFVSSVRVWSLLGEVGKERVERVYREIANQNKPKILFGGDSLEIGDGEIKIPADFFTDQDGVVVTGLLIGPLSKIGVVTTRKIFNKKLK